MQQRVETLGRVEASRLRRLRAAFRGVWSVGLMLVLAALGGVAPAGAAEVPAAPVARDPVEGFWLGTAGSTKEKIEVGFEFRTDASGKLKLRITQPISNYFAAEVGEVRREDERVLHDGMMLALTLRGDTLTGTYPGPNSPAMLRRVDALPQEPALPNIPTGPGPRWQARLGGQAYASPMVRDHVAYIGTTAGVLNAIDTRKGDTVWTFSAGAPIFGAAAVSDDAVYFVCDNGFLFKLDRSNGKELWRYDLGDGAVPRVLPHPSVFDWDWQAPQPLLADGVVHVGSGDGSFHAVDAASGQRRWRFETRGKIRTGAVIDGEQVVFGSADHFVYALDRSSGREIWRFDTRAEVDATPVIHAGRVLIGNRGVGLYALAADTGKELWRLYFWGSWVESTPAVRDGVIYIGSSDLRRVSAIDPEDGRVLWRSDVFGWSWGTPLLTPERIYVGVAGGTPYFIKHVASFTTLERKTGRILSRWPLPDTGGHQWGIAGSPALSDDTVVVATIEGSLLGFPMQ
jgi:outer membrane protein assembly factor BamB